MVTDRVNVWVVGLIVVEVVVVVGGGAVALQPIGELGLGELAVEVQPGTRGASVKR